ncbi:ABC transporter ATP-binding protein [Roseomonas haemaphysalidis]|uniref:ABC transporter ATP-binding protein n=1 Tax=Roseomonas haemaphysalidis TaxID=2768162 RepID=A0ABS3KWP0_9PROT|nr:ABC transporter ATP-binding protein [Roseomonas haemaphysalidis]MBO1080751.1 ABC transporter ATP-binding protein [Roseomonas haemaphysalidis]
MTDDTLLRVDDLHLAMRSFEGEVEVLKGVSFAVKRGEIWGIVGETGSGKSLTGLSVSRLVPTPPGRYGKGSIRFGGQDMLQQSEEAMRRLRGRRIGMIFQDPTTNLNPVFRIGTQLVDVAMHASRQDPALLGLPPGASRRERRAAAEKHAVTMLEKVGIANAAERVNDYPHQFSGGMKQRVLIAMALIGRPELLIADEPTTALDVSVQAQILRLIHGLVEEHDLGVVFITHNLGVVAQLCTHVAVMYAGAIVESGPVRDVLKHPRHDYTRGLLASVPKPSMKRGELRGLAGGALAAEALAPPPPRAAPGGTVLAIEHVVKEFPGARRGLFDRAAPVQALRDVSLEIRRGESFGLVGESGSGKTTLTRCILQLEKVTSGRIVYDGVDLTSHSAREMQAMRARIQIVFQDPYASLNPRMTVRDIIAEPLEIHHAKLGLSPRQRTDRAAELLAQVGLTTAHLNRYPHEFSGGQRQRIGIARALAPKPDFLILDEPTSALDVSVQAQVLNLLHDLQSRLGLTYFFISHDLGVIRYICDRVALIHHGRLVEQGETEAVFTAPQSDYAKMLLAAMPDPDPDLSPLRRPVLAL